MRRALGVSLLLLASVISQGLMTGARANHSDPKPNTTSSWYMSNVNHQTHLTQAVPSETESSLAATQRPR